MLAARPRRAGWPASTGSSSDDGDRALVGERARRAALLGWSPHRQGQRYRALLERAAADGEAGAPRRSSAWVPVAPSEPSEPFAHAFPADDRVAVPWAAAGRAGPDRGRGARPSGPGAGRTGSRRGPPTSWPRRACCGPVRGAARVVAGASCGADRPRAPRRGREADRYLADWRRRSGDRLGDGGALGMQTRVTRPDRRRAAHAGCFPALALLILVGLAPGANAQEKPARSTTDAPGSRPSPASSAAPRPRPASTRTRWACSSTRTTRSTPSSAGARSSTRTGCSPRPTASTTPRPSGLWIFAGQNRLDQPGEIISVASDHRAPRAGRPSTFAERRRPAPPHPGGQHLARADRAQPARPGCTRPARRRRSPAGATLSFGGHLPDRAAGGDASPSSATRPADRRRTTAPTSRPAA